MRLEGKVAIISGGARGMGATEARMFATEGAKVVFGDMYDDLGKQVETEINESSGETIYVSLDVTDLASWQDDDVVQRTGGGSRWVYRSVGRFPRAALGWSSSLRMWRPWRLRVDLLRYSGRWHSGGSERMRCFHVPRWQDCSQGLVWDESNPFSSALMLTHSPGL